MSAEYEMHPELGRKVPIASIDSELRALWDEDKARTNASLINFAVYSEAEGALVKNSQLIRELTRDHACRALLIGMNPKAEKASIESWITAHCHLLNGQKAVCCEQLAFRLHGHATGRLRNTVFAHLNSDLPLTLWWQGELSPIFEERFYSLIDRFIFDSAQWSDPLASFDRINEAAEQGKRIIFYDLEWSRSYQFRVSIAALFDDPVALTGLDSISKVTIEHHPEHRISAVQLVAWLAVQAGWRDGLELSLADQRVGDGREGFSFESKAGKPIMVDLQSNENVVGLASVKIEGEGLEIEVCRDETGKRLMRSLKCVGHEVEMPGPMDPDESDAMVGMQLSRGGRNTLFRKILPKFLALLSGHELHGSAK